MFAKIVAWGEQPTTIQGLAGILGTLSAVLLGQMSWGTATPILIGAAFMILKKDATAKTAP